MKTSFDISEPLLREVKALAKERGTTTRSLVEQALIKLLDDAKTAPPPAYELPDLSVPGKLRPEWENATWDDMLEEIYPAPKLDFGPRS